MGGLFGLAFQSQTHHLGNLFVADFSRRPGAGQVEKTFQARLVKTLAQRADSLGTEAGLLSDLPIIITFGASQDHPRSPRLGLRGLGTSTEGFQ